MACPFLIFGRGTRDGYSRGGTLFKHYLRVLAKNFLHERDLVIEGLDVLLKSLNATVANVAADLAAHRRNTEAHGGM